MPFKATETKYGIWRHQKLTLEGKLTRADAQKFADSQSVEHRLHEIEENAKRILKAARLPDFWGPVEIVKSGWRRPRSRDIETSRKVSKKPKDISGSDVLSMTSHSSLSQEHLAAKCLYFAYLVRDAIENGNAGQAAWTMMNLEQANYVGFTRHHWEPEILANRGSARGRQKGQATLEASHEERRRRHEAWRQRAEELRDDRPNLTNSDIARFISRKTGEKPETIRKRIRRKK